jgi:hypothetical protein
MSDVSLPSAAWTSPGEDSENDLLWNNFAVDEDSKQETSSRQIPQLLNNQCRAQGNASGIEVAETESSDLDFTADEFEQGTVLPFIGFPDECYTQHDRLRIDIS